MTCIMPDRKRMACIPQPETSPDDGRLCIRGVSFASEEDTGEDIVCRVPPWITHATGPVEEFVARNIENEKKRLENVMLAKERDIAQEDRICRGIPI